MLLAGIQARPELDPRLKHSGVTPLGIAALCCNTWQLAGAIYFLSASSAVDAKEAYL